MATERTPLRTGGPAAGPGAYDQAPTYVFMTNPGRAHRSKIRQFQCCVCAAILGVFVMALVITISYSVEHDDIDMNNMTTTTTTMAPTSSAPPLPPANGSLQLLLGSSWPRPDAQGPAWPGAQPDEEALKRAMEAGRDELNARAALEAMMTPMKKDTPSYRANQAVKTRPEATAMAKRGFLEEHATKELLKASGKKLSWRSGAGRGPRLGAGVAGPEGAACAEDELPLPCPATPYRSADGSCNNLQHPRTWGAAMRPFRRAMPPAYEDGVSKPRSDGLPAAREVSLTVHRPLYRNDPDFTVMLAVWGQFLDHDITATALSQAADGSAISCCNQDRDQHPECFPVRVAAGDPFYHDYNVTCMEFVRSAPAPTCSLGPREQLNQASSYVDASVVYGPTADLMRSLRSDGEGETAGGRLKMTMSPDGRELLPVSEDPTDGCNRQEMNDRGRYCFKSGDARANENLHLTTMHLLWARQHNRVAASLQRLNPHWNDERVFQESRRIVAAQMQHITYNEFLPVILGPHVMSQMELEPKAAGYDSSYDPSVDATVCNSFAAASFRFAHTLLPGLLKLIGNDTSSPEYMELHQMLFDPYSLYSRDGADRALRGAMDTGIERADNYFNPELTQKLFAPRSIGRGSSGVPACGLDLVSLNVQRGRDHGLPPYPAWREHCGLPRPATWDDLDGVMDEDSLKRLKEIYKSVDDVDLYTGALSEQPVEDGLLGGTLTCLLADQFVRLKRGDRFWYETDQQPMAFTPAQLAEIRKTSLAGVICGTSDGVHSAQPRVMRRAQDGANKRVPCAQLPRTKLHAWLERDGRYVEERADRVRATNNAPQDKDHVPDELVLVGATKADNAGSARAAARAVRVGGRVTSGSVTSSSGSSLWLGSLPTAIPLPTKSADAYLGGGVHWEGSLVATGNTATLMGTFSVDKFSITPGAAPQADGQVQGKVTVNFDVLWDSSSDGVIDLAGTFRSPVYLRALNSADGNVPLVDVRGADVALVAPVVLDGDYAPGDPKTFVWNGNFTLVLPTMAEDDAVMEEEDDQDVVSPAMPTYNVLKAGAPSNVRVEAQVLSGSVTAQGKDGAKVSWWAGTLPATIPTSPFDSKEPSSAALPADLVKPSARMDGVLWTAQVAASSPTTAQISGSFRVPRFVHGNFTDQGVLVEWWSGDFALNVQIADLGQGAAVDELLVPGQQYTSRLIFQSEKAAADPPSNARPQLSLAAAAQEVVDGAMPAPIILKGSFSADRASFAWSGKVVLVVPQTSPQKPALQLLGQAKPVKTTKKMAAARTASLRSSAGEMKLAATVKSGSVTAGRDDGSVSETTVWSGTFPASIPMPFLDGKTDGSTTPVQFGDDSPLYAHGIVWSGTLAASGTTLSLKGTYSVPRYLHGPTNNSFAIEWWKGKFSFELEPLWAPGSLDGLVDPGATYTSPVYFKGLQESSGASSMNAVPQRAPLGAFVAASLEQSEGALRAPVILQGTFAADRATFLWSGAVILALPRAAPPPAPQPGPGPGPLMLKAAAPGMSSVTAKTMPVRRIGIRVTSGNMYAYPAGAWFWRTWWTGALPTSVPVPIFDSRTSEYAPYPTGPLYHAAGAEWTGSITAVAPRQIKIQGKFSMPNYRHGPTGVVITWYYGTFLFQGDLLWNSTLDGIVTNDGKFTSHLYFKSKKSVPISKYPVQSSANSAGQGLSLQQFVMDSDQILDGSLRVPIVLDGEYSEDRSSFLWSGDAVITIPEPARPALPNALQASPKAKPTKVKDDTGKPKKPVKPPSLRIAAMVLGGSVNASYDNSSVTNIWSGEVPMWLPNPPTGVADWNLDSTVKWSGKLTSLDGTGKMLQLDGDFTMPYFEQGADGIITHEWKGTFSLQLRGLYSAVTAPEALKEHYVMSSRIVFVPPKASAAGDMSAPQLVLQAGDERTAVILLQGQYWFWSKSWFWWTGVASVSIPLDDGSPNPNAYVKPTQLGMAPGKTAVQAAGKGAAAGVVKVAVAAVEGSISAQREDGKDPAITLWSGALPAAIPASPFDGTSGPDSMPFNRSAGMPAGMGRAISWTGSLKPLDDDEAMLTGTFRFPRFLHPSAGAPGSSFSMEWWKGEFSLRLRALAGTSLAGVLSVPMTYSSPLVLKAMAANETVTVLLRSSSVYASVQDGFVMDSNAAAEGASKLPIILQGSFSPDATNFMWTGNAVLVLPMNAVSKTKKGPKKLLLTSSAKSAKTPKAAGAMSSSKVGATVTSGSVRAGKAGELPSTVWSGTFPVSLPAAKPASVLWSGSLQSTAPNTATLTGDFTTALAGVNGTAEWWSGDFTMQLTLMWNASVTGSIKPGVKYVTPVYYHTGASDETNAEQLASLSQEMASGGQKVLVFLDGAPSGDSFLWSGKVFLVLPKSDVPKLTLKAPAPMPILGGPPAAAGGRVTAGVVVTSGWVTPSVWGGQLPVAVPVAAIRSLRPLTWQGSVSASSTGTVVVKGTFSAPQYNHAVPGKPVVEWLTGSLSFTGRLLWNAPVADVLVSGANYTCMIHLQNSDTLHALEDVQDAVPAVWDRMLNKDVGVPAGEAARKLPIVLQGQFSEDGATFLWSGNVLVAIPIQ